MTVFDIPPVAIFTGNGVTTVFPYTFWIQQAEDLIVYKKTIATGVLTPLVRGVNFTITGISINPPGGGNVTTLGVPLSSLYKLIIARVVAPTQDIDIINQDGFQPNVLEYELDRIVMMIQGVEQTFDDRALTIPPGGTKTTVPGHVYITDANGNMVDGGIPTLAFIEDADLLPAVAETYLKRNAGNTSYLPMTSQEVYDDLVEMTFTLAAGGAVPVTQRSRNELHWSIDMFGGTSTDILEALEAIRDHIGDAGAAITKAEVVIPRGDWKISDTFISTTQSIQIKGVARPIIRWDGAAGDSMFVLRDSSEWLFEDLILLGKNGFQPSAAINYDGTAGVIGTNENLNVSRVRIGRRWVQDAGNATGFVYGIYVGGTSGNNDQFYIRQSSIHDCAVAGMYLVNTQSVWGRVEDTLFDTCIHGIYMNSNLHATNILFNRNDLDLRIGNNSRLTVDGYYSENAKQLILCETGGSFFIRGGKALLRGDVGYMVGDYWMDCDIVDEIVLENFMTQYTAGTPIKKARFTATSLYPGYIIMKGCSLGQPSGTGVGTGDGATRAAYELNVPTATTMLFFDIEQQGFVAKGRLDGTLVYDPGSMVDGQTVTTAFAKNALAGAVAGDPYLVSFSLDTQSIHLVGNCYANDSLYARFFNETGGTIDLASGKLRWRRLQASEIRCSATVVYDAPSLADGAGTTTTMSVPCNLGDFVYWGYTVDHRTMLISAYVSAANTLAVRIQNESGGTIDLASGNLSGYVIRPETFDIIGAKIIDPISLADGAGESFLVAVPGAELGDFVISSFSLDMQGISRTVAMQGTGIAQVRFQNETGGVIDLGIGVLSVGVFISLG